MSSLVCEVLASAGKLAKDDWNTKINKLNSRALEIKSELNSFIEQSYGDFFQLQSEAQDIDDKIRDVKQDAENLQVSLENMATQQLQEANNEFEQLSLQHSKTSALVAALEKLYKIHNLLEIYDNSLKNAKYWETFTAIKQVKAILDSVKESALGDTAIYKTLCIEVTIRQEGLIHVLTQAWNKCIIWKIPTDMKSSDFTTELSIHFDQQEQTLSAQDIVYTMHASKALKLRAQTLANMFLNNILIPLIKQQSVQATSSSVAGSSVLCIANTGLGSTSQTLSDKPFTPDEVFGKVWKALKFLYDNLLCLKLEEDKDDTMMSLFAPFICEETMKMLVDECLEKSVPNSKEELEAYDKIVETVVKFETSLKEIHFLPTDMDQGGLLAYVSDIHVHFANRRCTAIMAKARLIMKKEIHETSLITDGGKKDLENFFTQMSGANVQDDVTEQLIVPAVPTPSQAKEPPQDPLKFPRCRVSTSTLDLVNLVYETLYEALTASSECAMRLIATVEEIFEFFQSFVPNFHRDALENLPQVSAIHHNNCYYIAHHLITLGQQLSSRLSTLVKGIDLSFIQQVQPLRKLGEDCFLSQMRRQRAELMECLSPLKDFATNTNADKYEMAEKPIKQVMYQLHHLRKVWRGVLPLPMFLRSISALVDSSVAEVVNSICSMEDITSDDSIQLKTICCILRDQLPTLFSKPPDEDDDSVPSNFPFQRALKKWPRLLEVVFVLDASLRDIVDRWADGKGPLAAAFTVVEAKNLIKALFQNTDYRADAISKIRY